MTIRPIGMGGDDYFKKKQLEMQAQALYTPQIEKNDGFQSHQQPVSPDVSSVGSFKPLNAQPGGQNNHGINSPEIKGNGSEGLQTADASAVGKSSAEEKPKKDSSVEANESYMKNQVGLNQLGIYNLSFHNINNTEEIYKKRPEEEMRTQGV